MDGSYNVGNVNSTNNISEAPNELVNGKPSAAAEKPKHKKSKILRLVQMIAGGIALIVVIAALIGFLTGFLHLGFKKPEQQVTLRTVVCGDDIIKRYDEIRSSSEDNDTIAEEINKLSDEIAAKANADQDPTCQMILFWSAIDNGNLEAAKTAAANIQKAHDQGVFIDSNLGNIAPLDVINSFIQQGQGDPSEGQG